MGNEVEKALLRSLAADKVAKFLRKSESSFNRAREVITGLPEDGDQEAALMEVAGMLQILREEAEGRAKDYEEEHRILVERAAIEDGK